MGRENREKIHIASFNLIDIIKSSFFFNGYILNCDSIVPYGSGTKQRCTAAITFVKLKSILSAIEMLDIIMRTFILFKFIQTCLISLSFHWKKIASVI